MTLRKEYNIVCNGFLSRFCFEMNLARHTMALNIRHLDPGNTWVKERLRPVPFIRQSSTAQQSSSRPVYPNIVKQIRHSGGKCVNAYEIISNPLTLRTAYEMIKSKPGNMTRGTDTETLDGISKS